MGGEAFGVYKELPNSVKAEYEKVKAALLAAFGPGRFQAYGSLQSRVLREEETVEAYLSDIKRLILLTGVAAIPKQWVECAFINPSHSDHPLPIALT